VTPWVRLDDSVHSHRKVRRAGLEATGLWAMALSYSGFYLTDGFVDDDWITQAVPHPLKRQKLVEKLVKAGLFKRFVQGEIDYVNDRHGTLVQVGPYADPGYLIHDFLQHNPSRDEVEQRRKRERQKKRGQREMSPGDTGGTP
jgi:hypothetical protein